jgi:hypothetical protein
MNASISFRHSVPWPLGTGGFWVERDVHHGGVVVGGAAESETTALARKAASRTSWHQEGGRQPAPDSPSWDARSTVLDRKFPGARDVNQTRRPFRMGKRGSSRLAVVEPGSSHRLIGRDLTEPRVLGEGHGARGGQTHRGDHPASLVGFCRPASVIRGAAVLILDAGWPAGDKSDGLFVPTPWCKQKRGGMVPPRLA